MRSPRWTDKRVAIVATGGLSHRLPFPDWRRPVGEDEEFHARSWSEGRHDWKQFEVRRREIVVAARPGTNPAFDRRFLERLEAGRSEEHTSELQSLMRISYAVFCLKKKKKYTLTTPNLHTHIKIKS